MILPMIRVTPSVGGDPPLFLRGDLIEQILSDNFAEDKPESQPGAVVVHSDGQRLSVVESAEQVASSVAAAINFVQTREFDAQVKLAQQSAASALMLPRNGGKR